MSIHEDLMQQAIEICKRGIADGQTPFAAVIATLRGDVKSVAHNTVRSDCDPVAHAEINAIRAACRACKSIDLSGHIIVTTCEPCPMCAAAIHWARIHTVVFGASMDHAATAGFNELDIPCAAMLAEKRSRVTVVGGVLQEKCRALFSLWRKGPHPEAY